MPVTRSGTTWRARRSSAANASGAVGCPTSPSRPPPSPAPTADRRRNCRRRWPAAGRAVPPAPRSRGSVAAAACGRHAGGPYSPPSGSSRRVWRARACCCWAGGGRPGGGRNSRPGGGAVSRRRARTGRPPDSPSRRGRAEEGGGEAAATLSDLDNPSPGASASRHSRQGKGSIRQVHRNKSNRETPGFPGVSAFLLTPVAPRNPSARVSTGVRKG
jgi:hypothetical protein